MKIRIVASSLMLLLLVGTLYASAATEENVFREVSAHYEAIRLSLLSDAMTDVAEHARAIENRVDEALKEFDAQEAGVSAEKSDECEALLPEVSSAAARLAEAGDLTQAREGLFELSKPMGRYRKLAGTEGTMVVFCPMVEKDWIQPHGEIGNPYSGQGMPTCGEVVAD